MSGAVFAGPPRAARAAVGLAFLVNGSAYANWVPRIPEVKDALGLGDLALGTALLGSGLGGLVGSLAAGPLVARFGSRTVTVVSGLALAASIVLPGLAGSWFALATALATIGTIDAVMDVAMNAHGVLVERRYERPILTSFHGLWSTGATLGALVGVAAASLGIGPAVHFALVGVLLAGLVLASARGLLPTAVDRVGSLRTGDGRSGLLRPSRAVAVLGLLTLLAAFVEGVPADWSAVYLAQELGARAGAAGAAYAAFATAMLIGRFLGDRVVARWGPVATVRAGGLLAAAGMAFGLLLDSQPAAVAGFALVGFGVCTLFPVTFSAAGRVPGLPSGAAIGIVSLIGRGGFLVGPLVVGAVAELTSLRVALAGIVAAALAIAAIATGVRDAEPAPDQLTPAAGPVP